jgi:hypothetical protein
MEAVTYRSNQSTGPVDRLVAALVPKKVIPFLGAGFSYGAHHKSNGWRSTKDRMSCQLREWLEKACAAGSGSVHIDETLRYLYEERPQCDSLCHLAELASTLFGPAKVCNILGIHEYADLCPEPQHRYLAYLAREGVINEIITTNYDCCVETAFFESFYPPPKQQLLGVVRNVEEYRLQASSHRVEGHLLIYKINGCAGAYAQARAAYVQATTSENRRSWEAEADRIILAERQLQSFRDRGWAEDLVRDRFRSHCLFFSGFGNDEPQIRHTVLTLIREFSNGSRSEQTTSEGAFDLPNAPFLHSYEGSLSFNQLQVLVAFMDAHSIPHFANESPGECLANKSPGERLRPLYRNVIAPPENTRGSDGESREANRLAASTLMKEVFKEVFGRLVVKALQDEEPFPVWLRETTPEWRPWTWYLLRVVQRKRCSALHRRFCEMLSPEGDAFPLKLYRNLWAILYPEIPLKDSERCLNDWYASLREEPLLVLQAILWMCIFQSCKRPPEATAYGLRVKLRSGGNIHLIAREALRELQTDTEKIEGTSRLLRMVVVPTLRKDVVAWGRWRPIYNGRLRPGRWIAVDSADLVRASRRPQAVVDRLWDAFATVRPRRPTARLRLVSSVR